MAQTFKFLDMAQPVAPRNTLYDAIRNFGQTVGDTMGAIRERNRLIEIANAMRNGGLQGGADAALRVGELDRGINLQDKARTYSIQDEDRATKAQDRERERLASENLAGIVPQNVRGAAPFMSPNQLIALYGQSRQDNYNQQLLGLKRQQLNETTDLKRQQLQQASDQQMSDAAMRVASTLGFSPTREQWDKANEDGGLVHVAFGQKIPYEKAPLVLAQARKSQPTDDEFRAAGFSDEEIGNFKKQQLLNSVYGKGRSAPIGQGGQKVGREDRVDARSSQFFRELLDDAEKKLSTIPGGMVGRAIVKGLDVGEGGQAFADYEQSILGMVYSLSGKTTTNREMDRFLQSYSPKYGDSAERIGMKTARIRRFFDIVGESVNKGVPWEKAQSDAIARTMRERMEQEQKKRGGDKPAAPDPLGIR